MITLFLTLYAAAGVSAAPETAALAAPTVRATAKRGSTVTRPAPRGNLPQDRLVSTRAPLPAAIAGLLTKLPEEGAGWTRLQREQLMNAFGAVLDLCYPILGSGTSDADKPDRSR
jgi:hypothetical protein